MGTSGPSSDAPPVASRRAWKKVLFVTNTAEYGGAEKHLLDLIHRFREPKVSLCILCLDQDLFSERLGPDRDVEVISYKKTPRTVWDWSRLFRSVRADVVVFVHGVFWAIPYTAPVGAYLAGVHRRYSIQHLMIPRDPVPPTMLAAMEGRRSIRGRVRRLLGRPEPDWVATLPLRLIASMSSPAQLRRSARLIRTTICVSDALRDSLVRDLGFPKQKMKTIHNGVSVSEFVPSASRESEIRKKLGLDQDDFVLVCVARLSGQKGIDILLRAMALVLRAGLDCKCIILGDGPQRQRLLKEAADLALAGHVFFEGFHEDVRPYLQAGSAFVLTSHREGLPLSILEAMACGLPSVVTNVGGNSEAVADHIHGLVVPPGSPEAVAEAIKYLITHPEECARMSKSARERVCEAFDIEKAMAEIRRTILS